MRLAVTTAVLGLLGPVLLTSCSDDPSAAAPLTSSAVPSTTAPTAATTTTAKPDRGPTPPVMPSLASVESQSGGRAFIKYFVQSLNYGYLSLNERPMTKVSGQGCAVCSYVATDIKELRQNGGSQSGGEWKVRAIDFLHENPGNINIYIATIDTSQGFIKASATAHAKRLKAGRRYVEFHARHQGNRWLMTVVSAQ